MKHILPFYVGLLVFVPSGFTQTARSHPKSISEKAKHATVSPLPKYLFDNLPFREPQVNLPVDFHGVDIKRIFHSIEHSTLLSKKSEFESTLAYQERLDSFSSSSILPGVMATDLIAVVLNLPESTGINEPLSITYDADFGAFIFKSSILPKRMYLLPEAPSLGPIDIATDQQSSEDYIGSNAMGAKVQVHEASYDSYGVAVTLRIGWLYRQIQGVSTDTALTFKVKVSQATAQILKPQLRAALVGKLRGPWIAEDIVSHDPTIDNPYKLIDAKHYVVMDPSEVLIFRADTGEVLKRLNAKTIETEQALAINLYVTCGGVVFFAATIDGKSDHLVCSSETKILRADKTIRLESTNERDLSAMTFRLNGNFYSPEWTRNETSIGSYKLFRSASFTITAP